MRVRRWMGGRAVPPTVTLTALACLTVSTTANEAQQAEIGLYGSIDLTGDVQDLSDALQKNPHADRR